MFTDGGTVILYISNGLGSLRSLLRQEQFEILYIGVNREIAATQRDYVLLGIIRNAWCFWNATQRHCSTNILPLIFSWALGQALFHLTLGHAVAVYASRIIQYSILYSIDIIPIRYRYDIDMTSTSYQYDIDMRSVLYRYFDIVLISYIRHIDIVSILYQYRSYQDTQGQLGVGGCAFREAYSVRSLNFQVYRGSIGSPVVHMRFR